MPKKRTNNFKSLQGTSSSGRPLASRDGGEKAASVNERLSELRKLEGKDAAQKKREFAEAATASVNQRSVPPNVRAVLGVPDIALPTPKRGPRARMPNRTPGPAPPRSWLARPALSLVFNARNGRRRLNSSSSADPDRNRPNELLRFAHMSGEEPTSDQIGSPSLVHLCLKASAQNWDLFDHEDLPALTEIPLRLRLRLLSYLGFFGPTIDVAVLDAITDGSEAVTHLDLAGLFGHGALNLHRIVKLIKQQSSKVTEATTSDTVAESWDQEESLEAAIAPRLSMSRFAHLTHLSLSHPPALGASWRDLLQLSKHIPRLTHLSLAYWPRPTLTPNLATATVSSQHSPEVHAGGSHYYSDLDRDLTEPASLLRQLSGHLLYLQWLDLEGCTEWFPAFAFRGEGEANQRHNMMMDDNIPTVSMHIDAAVSMFVHNWKNLKYLNCAQGWLPTISSLTAIRNSSNTTPEMRITIDSFLRGRSTFELLKAKTEAFDLYDVEKRKADIWVKNEVLAFNAQLMIRELRHAHACSMLTIDDGWSKKG